MENINFKYSNNLKYYYFSIWKNTKVKHYNNFKLTIRLPPNVRAVCIEKAKAKLVEIVRAGPEDIKSLAEHTSRPALTQQPTQVISYSCLQKFNFMDADSTAAQNKSKKKTQLEREIDLYMSEPFKKIDPCEYWK